MIDISVLIGTLDMYPLVAKLPINAKAKKLNFKIAIFSTFYLKTSFYNHFLQKKLKNNNFFN